MVTTSQFINSETGWSFNFEHAGELISCFPELEKEIINQVANIYMKSSAVNIPMDRLSVLDKYYFKRTPKDYQLDTLKNMLMENQHGVFLDCGLGKSQVCVNFIDLLHQFENDNYKALIICPKSLFYNWTEEIKINSNLDSVVVFGSNEKRRYLLEEEHNIYIINYEGVVSLRNYNMPKFDMVFVDESTKIKNPKALRTKIITDKFKNVFYKYILTGTPISQNLVDLFAQLFFLNPDYLGYKKIKTFKNHHCIYDGVFNNQITGYKNINELKIKANKHCTRIKTEDVLPSLPERIYQTRYLELEGKIHKQYKNLEKNNYIISGRKRIEVDNILTKFVRLSEITSGLYLNDDKNNLKLTEVNDIIEDNKGNQFVIWFRFRRSMELVRKLLDKKNITYSMMHGDIKDRGSQTNNFKGGDSQVMLAQLDISEGQNWQEGRIIIFYENDFRRDNREQAEKRSHRIGVKTSPVFFDLVYRNTIDEIIIQAIKFNKDITDYLLDNYKGAA